MQIKGIEKINLGFKKISKNATDLTVPLLRGGLAIERDAKKIVPVKTSHLKRSISARMKGKQTVIIEAGAEYAGFVELGTSRMKAQPYMRPAFDNNINTIKRDVIKHVMR